VAVELIEARPKVEATETTDAARAVAAELEALCGSSAGNSISGDSNTNNELRLAREAAQEQTTQWVATPPMGGARDGSLDRRRRTDGAPGADLRGGNLDGRGRAGGVPGDGRVDRDRGLYRQCSSPSPDRYHGHCGV
jgi:hypothetical protein